MACVGLQVALVAIFCALVKVVVLRYELVELGLDVDDLFGGEIEFYNGNTGVFEVGEETDFGGLEEEEGSTFAVRATRCSTDTVDVISWVIRGVELNYPVYVWDLM
jgi:hypothetical protein